jgi:hypothetical protein
MAPPQRSQRSGELLDPGAPAAVTYLFADGHRRQVTVSVAEADELRGQGEDRTSGRDRALARARRTGPLFKWVATALGGAVIGALISDHYSDLQRENELEGELITAISRDAVTLFQHAQEAARATTDPEQQSRRDQAADEWVRQSSELTPMFEAYYPGTPVLEHWNDYQAAMYQWAVLGCCTTDAGRPHDVKLIRTYLTGHDIRATTPPVDDPWRALVVDATPDQATYQWVGFYLLRGRGALLRDLNTSSPDLD